MYRCQKCGRENPDVQTTFDIRYGKSYCFSCKGRTDHVLDSVAEGQRLKAEGQASAEEHAEETSWTSQAKEWVLRKPKGVTYTSEDITADIGQPPSSGAVGAVMTGMAKMGWHRKYFITKAARPGRHAGEIWTWVRI